MAPPPRSQRPPPFGSSEAPSSGRTDAGGGVVTLDGLVPPFGSREAPSRGRMILASECQRRDMNAATFSCRSRTSRGSLPAWARGAETTRTRSALRIMRPARDMGGLLPGWYRPWPPRPRRTNRIERSVPEDGQKVRRAVQPAGRCATGEFQALWSTREAPTHVPAFVCYARNEKRSQG